MAGTVTASAVVIWDAESTSGWTLNKGDVYSGWQREGNYCLADQVSQTSFTEIYDYQGQNGTTLNLQGKFVTFWVLLWGSPNTLANAGVGYYLEDTAGNAVILHLGGSDKQGMWWGSGWQAFGFYADATFLQNNVTYTQSSGSSFPDLTQIAKVGVHFNITSKAVGTSPNVNWDISYAIDYIQLTGGTSDDPATFEDLVSADDTNAWGVFSKQGQVYFAQGKFRIGDTTNDTYFHDENRTVIFMDMPVPDGFYEFTIYRGSSNNTTFIFGEKSGETGVGGILMQAPSDKRFLFDAYTNYDTTSMSSDEFSIYGSTFNNAYEIRLPDSSYAEFLNTNVISSGIVKPYSATVKYCNFITADSKALHMISTHNISNCSFISNPTAVYIDVAGDYTFDALTFLNNTYDIENASDGTVNVYAINGSNPTTYLNSGGGETNIINSVYVTVYVKDKNLNPIQGAQVYVYNLDDGVVVMNTDTDSDGMAQTTWNYTGDKNVLVRVRKSSPSEERYIPIETYGVITSDGYTTTVILYEDLVV